MALRKRSRLRGILGCGTPLVQPARQAQLAQRMVATKIVHTQTAVLVLLHPPLAILTTELPEQAVIIVSSSHRSPS